MSVVPSPKSHAYDAMEPSGSDDPVPSNEQVSNEQLLVNDAVGAWLGEPAAADPSTTVHIVSTVPAAFAVAVSPPTVAPWFTGAPPSVASAQTCPPPAPHAAARCVSPAGGVRAVVVEDFSVHKDTTQLPSVGTVTVGVVCDVPLTVSFFSPAAVTGFVVSGPR